MIYECERCDFVLSAGWTSCPRCGEVFDEPVPADALPDELEGTFALPPAPPPPAVAPPPPPVISVPVAPPLPAPSVAPAQPGRRPLLPRLLAGLAASLALIGTGWWLGQRHAAVPAPPADVSVAPASTPTDGLPTDTVAHPTYAAEMAAFVNQLRATGVGAQWPAGSNDVLVITPPAVVDGTKALWDKDTYQRLAQGVYGNFAQNRFHAGFSDTDSTTCFVIVSDPSGKVVATDLMGDVE